MRLRPTRPSIKGSPFLLLGPSYFFISLVLGPLNRLVWYVPSLRYTRGLGWRMHCGVEVTESSTNKQHHIIGPSTKMFAWGEDMCYERRRAEACVFCHGANAGHRSIFNFCTVVLYMYNFFNSMRRRHEHLLPVQIGRSVQVTNAHFRAKTK
jgi:hypothetical protein